MYFLFIRKKTFPAHDFFSQESSELKVLLEELSPQEMFIINEWNVLNYNFVEIKR